MFEKKVKETKEVTKKKIKKAPENPWDRFGAAFTDGGTCGSHLSAYGEVI